MTIVPTPVEPHRERSDSVNFNPTTPGRLLFMIWDTVLLFGPMTRDEVASYENRYSLQDSAATAWYAEEHPDERVDRQDFVTRQRARRWSIDREIEIGLARGHLVEGDDGLLNIGTKPGQHEVFAWLGGVEGAKTLINRMGHDRALTVLRAKTNPARRKPIRRLVTGLRKDLAERDEAGVGEPGSNGQIYPCLVWRPTNLVDEQIVLDGQTRMEAQAERGVEPWIKVVEYRDAMAALWTRVSAEWWTTTKDQSTEARDAYIAELREQKVTQTEIAKQVGLSQKRVSEVLSTVYPDVYRGQREPTEAEVDEWVRLADGGWSFRAISVEFPWSKSVIAKHVGRRRLASDATPSPAVEAPILAALADAPVGLSADEVTEVTGLPANVVTAAMTRIKQTGLAEPTGERVPTKRGKTGERVRLKPKGIEQVEINEAFTPVAPPVDNTTEARLERILTCLASEVRIDDGLRAELRKRLL